jgi:hypothetical protein
MTKLRREGLQQALLSEQAARPVSCNARAAEVMDLPKKICGCPFTHRFPAARELARPPPGGPVPVLCFVSFGQAKEMKKPLNDQ